jgi:hypothetical protein
MRAAIVKTSYDAPDLSDDTHLAWPTAPRTAGLNLIGKGTDVLLDGGEMNGWRVFAAGSFRSLHIRGLRGDFSKAPQDALPLNCAADQCIVENCRFTGINGEQAGIHGDGIQLQDNSSFGSIIIRNTTILTAYQGIMHNRGATKIILENVNIRDEPTLRKQLSIALYIANSHLILKNVWIDWPSANHRTFLRGTNVEGEINIGIPPDGDFVK